NTRSQIFVVLVRLPLDVKDCPTLMTYQNRGPHGLPKLLLQDRLAAVAIAVCTYVMLWVGAAHVFLNRISRHAPSDLGKLVALLLCFPCFEISNFFFKLAYLFQQRRLRRIGLKCASLGGENYAVEFDDLVLNHDSVAEAYHCLSDFACRLNRSHHCSNSAH